MVESAKIVLQAIDSMPSGPLQAKVPKVIKVPKGRTYVREKIQKEKWATTLFQTVGWDHTGLKFEQLHSVTFLFYLICLKGLCYQT